MALLWAGTVNANTVYDSSRDRHIPVTLSYPVDQQRCTKQQQCPVAFVSAGYGVSHNHYTFITQHLNRLGYLVVAVAHELPQDPPLSVQGNLYQTRQENWIRGAQTLDFLTRHLADAQPNYRFDAVLLVGHSNGGDISAWLANEGKPYVDKVITLDHRRVPLPRSKEVRVLSIRASDFPADEGVLPTEEERQTYASCVVKIPESRHNDMSDHGPAWLKQTITTVIDDYLVRQACDLPD
ncbi:alpha/beta hydrolase [Aestuariibacter halophilus]|uniref:Alpha/beta hydrolase n=1 Tax=Fluctibacter halophilus TaxID=226011 RepID=A0ABS8GE69_9ALTE|nr:alpha/beta hydrolase [Aestuariibacter halophilus]MCC2618195.1 alpha/beta hydrolase [Aestuariibacter halophilus]